MEVCPCGDGSSTVNGMCGSWLLMCWSSDLLHSALVMTKVSSTNLSHREGEWGQELLYGEVGFVVVVVIPKNVAEI